MSKTTDLNRRVNIKQLTSADLNPASGQPVINRPAASTSTAGQTVINLPFFVNSNEPESFLLFVDGQLLAPGASNDFQFTSVDGAGYTSQVTLNSPLTAGLSIQPIKLGTKKEREFGTDSRFTQIYDAAGSAFQGFVDESSLLTASASPGANQFLSTVVGRASIPDIRNDLKARMGIDRISVQQIYEIQNEFGPNGERVWGALNDDRGLIRFVGTWGVANVSIQGVHPATSNVNDYVEIVFYGTGLNLLTVIANDARDARASVDGGAEGANIFLGSSSASVLNGRNYNTNTILPVTSGLALGVHTVKIRTNAIGTDITAFEVLNEASTINVRPGTAYNKMQKLVSSSAQNLAYNSSFDQIVRDGSVVTSLGARGARVVAYMDSDGSIKKRAVAVNSAQANLSSADHTNEEIIRSYSFREFGAGRSDDFSGTIVQGGGGSARAFTLEDGTTTLVGSTGTRIGASGEEGIGTNGAGEFITITFVGCGLDIKMFGGNGASLSASVDGGSAQNITGTTTAALFTQKIVSGLPYGTHTVKFNRGSASGTNWGINQFIVYQPKKPSIPSGAIELADYNVMADFVANSTAGLDTIAVGVLRKQAAREMVYVNGTGGSSDWAISGPNSNSTGGFQLDSDRQNSYLQYTFFGTGFEFRFRADNNRSANISVTLNGLSATTANYPTLVSSVYGTGVAFSSGTLDQLDASPSNGAGLRISGLPIGRYTVRFNNNTASSFIVADALDIITPIHAPRSSVPADLQNTLPVGSCALSDSRKVTPIKSEDPGKFYAQASAVVSNPTTSANSFVPVPDMSLAVRSPGARFSLSYTMQCRNNSAAQFTITQMFLNGRAIGTGSVNAAGTGNDGMVSEEVVLWLPAGVHKLDIMWYAEIGGNTVQTVRLSRKLTAKQLP